MCHPAPMTTPFEPTPISVCLMAPPDVSVSVLHGLHETLGFVGHGWEMMTGWAPGPRRFRSRIVARARTPFRAASGLTVAPDLAYDEVTRADLVILPDLVVGYRDDPRGHWPAEAAFLRRMQAGGAVICSVCTASLLLAEAGLLDGVEATCHWAAVDQMRRLYPRVQLKAERVIVPAGPGHAIVTAGASASWTDLVLYLVARFCGEDEARRTAKLFLFGDRSDGQLPFAARVRPRQHDDAAIAAAQVWIADNYAGPNPVAGMTAAAGLAPRTFKRRFAAATGYAPQDYVLSLRMEEAKQMLETTDLPIDAVAGEVGYGEPAGFRRIFRRATGVSPLAYRQRFRRPVSG